MTQSSPSPEAKQEPLPEPPTPPRQSVISSSSRKRHRPNSPLSGNPSYSSKSDTINKSSVPKPNRRLSIAVIPPTVDIEHPIKGDIIEMENGSRKKFDGVVWRTICSLPGCLIAAQRNELCRKHFIKLNGKPNTAPTMATNMIGSGTMLTPRANSSSSIDEKSGKFFGNIQLHVIHRTQILSIFYRVSQLNVFRRTKRVFSDESKIVDYDQDFLEN
jgi:hypothetical protein